MRLFLFLVTLMGVLSCASGKMTSTYTSNRDKVIADLLLTEALDHEALYTLLDTLKPISSVKHWSFRVSADTAYQGETITTPFNQPALDSLAWFSRMANALSTSTHRFVLVPFERTDKGTRYFEMYVVHAGKLTRAIQAHAGFFGRLGITPDTDPATVITIVEYAHQFDRWRGYGYLFGYPDYAVDFFVNAGMHEQQTREFVTRSFFQIPVFAANSGHFTYAMPKNHIPAPDIDSVIYRKAMRTLQRYRKVRGRYLHGEGLAAYQLWKKESRMISKMNK